MLAQRKGRSSATLLANGLSSLISRAVVALPIGETGCQSQVDRELLIQ